MEKANRQIFQIIALILFSLWATPATAQDSLELRISGIESSEGKIMILVQSAEGDTLLQHIAQAKKGETIVSLPLSFGRYAIATYHDKNGNQKLDKSFLGYPIERYGFSNNARELFGPPSLESRVFTFSSNSKSHRIKIE